jgi:hemin uptake protein HemP
MAKPPNAVILSEAKNLLFFFSSQKKIKRGDPSAYSLRMTRKGKLTKF